MNLSHAKPRSREEKPRHCEQSEAIQTAVLLDCFALLAMTISEMPNALRVFASSRESIL
jgi:hypothetical protein